MSTISASPILTARAAERAKLRHAIAVTVGRRLAWSREAAGISQEALGAYMGVSRGTVSNIERGERALRPGERACAARCLGCSIATLTGAAIRLPAATNGNGRIAA